MFGGRCLPRGEDAVAPQVDNLFKCAKGIAAQVERAMERDVYTASAGGFYQPAAGAGVDVAVGSQSPDYDSVASACRCRMDVFSHAFDIRSRVDEIASSRPDEHMER